MLGSPKYNEKTEEYIRVKKAIRPKDGTIFDFMIRPPNDKSEVINNSPLLNVPESEVKRFQVENNDIVSETTEAEFEVVEGLLQEASIANNDREPSSRKPLKKLTISETALDREKKLQSPVKKDQIQMTILYGGIYYVCVLQVRNSPALKFMKLFKQQLPAYKELQNYGSLNVKVDRMDFTLIWELN
ncbi:unnamed protein product [Rhizophagus irregularis]|nr:unnamed protein product [Rhizophagus irregularis]